MSGRDSSRNSSDSEIRETGQNVRSIPLTSATAAGIGNKESAVSSSAAKKKMSPQSALSLKTNLLQNSESVSN